jgi:hypothetical protein
MPTQPREFQTPHIFPQDGTALLMVVQLWWVGSSVRMSHLTLWEDVWTASHPRIGGKPKSRKISSQRAVRLCKPDDPEGEQWPLRTLTMRTSTLGCGGCGNLPSPLGRSMGGRRALMKMAPTKTATKRRRSILVGPLMKWPQQPALLAKKRETLASSPSPLFSISEIKEFSNA